MVKQVSSAFDLYWNNELAYPATVLRGEPPTPEEIEQKTKLLREFAEQQADSPYLQALRDSDLANNIRHDRVRYHWGDAEVLYDQPEKLVQDFS